MSRDTIVRKIRGQDGRTWTINITGDAPLADGVHSPDLHEWLANAPGELLTHNLVLRVIGDDNEG